MAAFQAYLNLGSCPFGLYVSFTRNSKNIRPSEQTKIGYTSLQFSVQLDAGRLLIYSLTYTSVHASMAGLDIHQVAEALSDGQCIYFR